ncbi:MAG: hypothetical protein Q9227_002251 [Pyrenula ochraceoflavens]
MELPTIPKDLSDFLPHLAEYDDKPIDEVLQPYKAYESKLREIFAQEPNHPAIANSYVNTTPIFDGHQDRLKIRARNLAQETDSQTEKYLLTLPDNDRKANGSLATVQSLKDFQNNFNLFSESSLVDLDWSNVVAAGSSVVTSLLPVADPHNKSKRAQRAYYHEQLAPASDVDLFIYGLDEKQAVEKIRQIESKIRDSILSETTTIRTKNAITIASQYPIRHVQIVLRLYKSVSEILTGFDVDCSSVAYDGSQVWATPRAIGAFMTQINTVDLSRRSPSYENRLSKYSHRGFEVYWPLLDRSRIDPTIFERSFSRVMGLARLLVLEKLPHPNDRDDYLAKRRAERGRPELPWNARYRRLLPGNVKDQQPDDVAEWVEEDEVSNYHTFTVPYGPKYNAKKIEKLLFTKDLLLNAEWNRSKDRETALHRHPAFFGSVNDVIHDCCGFCPDPVTDEDLEAAEEEDKIYIRGDITFIKDDPGRQTIGSFNPLTDDDWTEMAFVGNTARLFQAIVDRDLEGVQDWCDQEDADVNRRDHTGRTPLQVASMCSTPEIVNCLIEHGARLVARVYDGFTALHIAAHRGDASIVEAILEKSEENEEEEDRKEEERKATRRLEKEIRDKHSERTGEEEVVSEEESEEDDEESIDLLDQDLKDSDDSEGLSDRITEGSFVRVRDSKSQTGITMPDDAEDKDEPDVYDVNVLAWDNPVSPLHLAILGGHVEVVRTLVDRFGADVMLPVKLLDDYDRSPRAAILTLVIAMRLDKPKALKTTKALLDLGASSSQADMDEISALHYVVAEGSMEVLDMLVKFDGPAAKNAINHLSVRGSSLYPNVDCSLLTAVRAKKPEMVEKLLSLGAEPMVSQETFARAYHRRFENSTEDPEEIRKIFNQNIQQPIVEAVNTEQLSIAELLLREGADAAILTKQGYEKLYNPDYGYRGKDESFLDLVQSKLAALREFDIGKKELPDAPPKLLPDDEHYLKDLLKGSYRYWLAQKDLDEARDISRRMWKKYDDEIARIQQPENGAQEKLVKVRDFAKQLEHFEALIKDAGAKTFYEMNPSWKRPEKSESGQPRNNWNNRNNVAEPKPYETFQNFLIPDLTPIKKDAYFQLFEAAWEGDIQTIKSLTLSSPKQLKKPLQITVRDLRGFSPFSIAILRNHKACAKAIADIATVQYKPEEKADRIRYRFQPADNDDENSSSNEDGVEIYKELVDEDFTVTDIGALANEVKSSVSPADFLDWDCQVWRFIGDLVPVAKAKLRPLSKLDMSYYGWLKQYTQDHFNRVFSTEDHRNRHSLIKFAIVQNDISLLKFLLELGSNIASAQEDENSSKVYIISPWDYDLAVSLGRLEMIGEMLKRTGTKLPLQSLVSQSGIKIQEKPRYYQGLSVHGKKRRDWADAGRGMFHQPMEDAQSPLFSVVFQGNIDSTEYFLGNAPLRCYMEFTENHKSDKRISALNQAEGGLEKALTGWLGAHRHLALHVAIASPPRRNGSTALLECILKSLPESIESRTLPEKMTPLATAFDLCRYNAARFLIDAGANQTVRDSQGRNILHIIFENTHKWAIHPRVFHAAISLLDPKLLPSMLVERCSLAGSNSSNPGATTPLAILLHAGSYDTEIVKIVLDFSQGKDLEVMDGAGDYPLHTVVRNNRTDIVKIILDRKPELLFWENATGMTPFEIVDKEQLSRRVDWTPNLPGEVRYPQSIVNEHPSHFIKDNNKEKVRNEDRDEIDVGDGREKIKGNGYMQTYNLFTRSMALWKKEGKHPLMKRKLVSLFDANEVAKRLARQERRNRTYMPGGIGREDQSEADDGNEGTKVDDVSDWIGSGRHEKAWDLKALEKKFREEEGEHDEGNENEESED